MAPPAAASRPGRDLHQDLVGPHHAELVARALLDGVLKYKKLFREFPAPPSNHFLYDPQERHRGFVPPWERAGPFEDEAGIEVRVLFASDRDGEACTRDGWQPYTQEGALGAPTTEEAA